MGRVFIFFQCSVAVGKSFNLTVVQNSTERSPLGIFWEKIFPIGVDLTTNSLKVTIKLRSVTL